MKKCFVGFDTSNYTTSMAVCDENGKIIANLKKPLSVKAGERGLRQSDAVFAHVKNIPILADQLSEIISGEYSPLAIGVSSRPRDAENSYMPCFLSGVAAAHSFAAALGIPVVEVSHQNGHVMAAAYSSGNAEKLFSAPFLAFHLSGGTTEALLIKPDERGFSVDLVGETLDLNAGQVIDRVGVSLGLDFPCGAELEALANGYSAEGKRKRCRISVKNGCCNLSGLENMAAELYAKTDDKNRVAAFVFDFIGETVKKMTEQLLDKHGNMPVLYAGGVMSNMYMRSMLSDEAEAYFSEPAFSSDNAAGVSLLCRKNYLNGK